MFFLLEKVCGLTKKGNHCIKTENLKQQQNSKYKILTKLKNLNCEKTQNSNQERTIIKTKPKTKQNKNGTKLNNPNSNSNKKFKIATTQILKL